MKKKAIKIILITICVLLLAGCLRGAALYIGNYAPNKSYFGDEYTQVLYPTSISDRITANKILKEANTALSTITEDETVKKTFGELGYLCVDDDTAVAEKHKLKLIAAHFSKSTGYVWVKYSSEAYDKDGEVTCGSWSILSRWELEKKDDQWVVTSIKEHP